MEDAGVDAATLEQFDPEILDDDGTAEFGQAITVTFALGSVKKLTVDPSLVVPHQRPRLRSYARHLSRCFDALVVASGRAPRYPLRRSMSRPARRVTRRRVVRARSRSRSPDPHDPDPARGRTTRAPEVPAGGDFDEEAGS